MRIRSWCATRHRVEAAGIPAYRSGEVAVQAFAALATHVKNQRLLLESPPSGTGVRGQGGLALFIGPEGGWTSDEAARLLAAGARPLDLGPFTLRTETAAIVGLGALRALAGAERARGS